MNFQSSYAHSKEVVHLLRATGSNRNSKSLKTPGPWWQALMAECCSNNNIIIDVHRNIALAPRDLSLSATSSKHVALLAHEFDAHFHEMCNIAGCAQQTSNKTSGRSSSSNNSKSAVPPCGSASGSRTTTERQAVVLAKLPLFGARLTRLETGHSAANAVVAIVAVAPGDTASIPALAPAPSTALAVNSSLVVSADAAATANTPKSGPALATSARTPVDAAPASGSSNGQQFLASERKSSDLSGVIVGETRNAWTIISDDPESNGGTGTLHVAVKAGAKFALHWRDSTFKIDGNVYVGRLSGQPLTPAEKRGETQARPESSSKPKKAGAGIKKRPASAIAEASSKTKTHRIYKQ